ncbi:response regulator [Streptomyces griseoviridis]|uniref:Response regulatory domain-containing protein n=2 Tax=Streptomyces griseoviridis TaxID=45398 RepID=A0A918L8K5_STRGD|nr:response regulator [Streptomyces niveoruber]GGS18935.1 hypothetical protein GCM10010238_03860 [Streptomyces niveoruber]
MSENRATGVRPDGPGRVTGGSAGARTDERAGILLVDDMEDNLIALEAVLGSLDEPLVRARSGGEALRALQCRRFALVLLDVRMPGMDGFETAAEIRRLDRAKDVPIIFLTGADDDPGYAFRGYATGAADYLAKPFDPWVLRAKVGVFLDLHRKNRQLELVLARERAVREAFEAWLAGLEAQLDGTAPPDVPALRRQVRELRDLVARGGRAR